MPQGVFIAIGISASLAAVLSAITISVATAPIAPVQRLEFRR